MPIKPYDGSAVRVDPAGPNDPWHITTVMDTDAKPHPVVITHCARRLPIVGVVFEELQGKIGVCSDCARSYANAGTKQ